jgi:hypothetical protein
LSAVRASSAIRINDPTAKTVKLTGITLRVASAEVELGWRFVLRSTPAGAAT